MKKWVLITMAFFLLLSIFIYAFIPSRLQVSAITIINSTVSGTNRILMSENSWRKWWPPNHLSASTSDNNLKSFFSYNGDSYQISKFKYHAVELLIEHKNLKTKTNLYILPLTNDSVVIEWRYSVQSSLNPIRRWHQYQQCRKAVKDMTVILKSLKSFLEIKSNIYRFDIKEIISKDSTLIATKRITTTYPASSEIYLLVDKLKKYIAKQDAIETNYPMLNVKKLENNKYETMVAIPVNKQLKGNGIIVPKRFVPWKTLIMEVKGGFLTIDAAYKELQLFIEDYQRTSMAIPFESLITDRRIEQDTMKWISIICQPVS